MKLKENLFELLLLVKHKINEKCQIFIRIDSNLLSSYSQQICNLSQGKQHTEICFCCKWFVILVTLCCQRILQWYPVSYQKFLPLIKHMPFSFYCLRNLSFCMSIFKFSPCENQGQCSTLRSRRMKSWVAIQS